MKPHHLCDPMIIFYDSVISLLPPPYLLAPTNLLWLAAANNRPEVLNLIVKEVSQLSVLLTADRVVHLQKQMTLTST